MKTLSGSRLARAGETENQNHVMPSILSEIATSKPWKQSFLESFSRNTFEIPRQYLDLLASRPHFLREGIVQPPPLYAPSFYIPRAKEPEFIPLKEEVDERFLRAVSSLYVDLRDFGIMSSRRETIQRRDLIHRVSREEVIALKCDLHLREWMVMDDDAIARRQVRFRAYVRAVTGVAPMLFEGVQFHVSRIFSGGCGEMTKSEFAGYASGRFLNYPLSPGVEGEEVRFDRAGLFHINGREVMGAAALLLLPDCTARAYGPQFV